MDAADVGRSVASPTHCPNCGEYMPMNIVGTRRIHNCDRTPPLDGLPTTIYVCPVCGGHAARRYGCWGSREHPHEHAFMRPVHEFVREAVMPDSQPVSRSATSRPKITDLIVHDPDDARRLSRDALDTIDELLLSVPQWDGIEDARAAYMALVKRYETLFGCMECGLMNAHKLACSQR